MISGIHQIPVRALYALSQGNIERYRLIWGRKFVWSADKASTIISERASDGIIISSIISNSSTQVHFISIFSGRYLALFLRLNSSPFLIRNYASARQQKSPSHAIPGKVSRIFLILFHGKSTRGPPFFICAPSRSLCLSRSRFVFLCACSGQVARSASD